MKSRKILSLLLALALVMSLSAMAVTARAADEAEPTTRHPLYIAADKLKAGLSAMGFFFAQNGDGKEVQAAGTNFQTFAEPKELAWKDAPIALTEGKAELRTRMLPAFLKSFALPTPARVALFGNVYNSTDAKHYKSTEIEGIFFADAFGEKDLGEFWNRFAVVTFGVGSTAELKSVTSPVKITMNEGYKMETSDAPATYAISVTDPAGKSYTLGYVGPATDETMALVENGSALAWVFDIDVAAFAVQYVDGVDSLDDLQSVDVAYLSQFKSDEASFGGDPIYQTIDLMRSLGYTEVQGDVILEPDAYVKMNMIQESWDSNNTGVQLVEALDGRSGLRTVMTPALEEVLSANFALGNETVKVFEVGHIFSVVEDSDLPYERVSLCLMAYGPDVTMDSMTADVEALLDAFGMEGYVYTTTDVAIAYVIGQCTIPLNPTDYSTPGNYGPISEVALENHGIKAVQPYMGNFEINTLAGY